MAVGVSLNLIYQRFKATGLADFCNYKAAGCADPTAGLTDQGYDTSTGYSVKLGWTGKVSDRVTLGAAYQTRSDMSKFDKYNQLFAQEGGFDIPSNYTVGLTVQATPKLSASFDIQQINYSEIKSIANPNTSGSGAKLGTDNGPGFGWNDMTVYKLGFEYQYSPKVKLRAGYSHTKQPIGGDDTSFNLISMAVPEEHMTIGGTWTLANGSELSAFYAHVPKKTVNGSTPGNPYGTGYPDIYMGQDAVGVAYGWKY